MGKNTLKSCLIMGIMGCCCALANAGELIPGRETAAVTGRMDQVDLAQRIDQARLQVKINPKNVNDMVELARALYLGGVQTGNAQWLDESRELWGRLHDTHQADPLILVYLGSLRVLEAKDAPLFWDKAKLLRQGQANIEQSLTAAPQDMEILWLASVTAWNLPTVFGVRDKARAGFTRLAAELVQIELENASLCCAICDALQSDAKRMVDNLEPAMKASVWLHHGQILWQSGDRSGAMAAWQQAMTAAPGSTAAIEAGKWINEHAEPSDHSPAGSVADR